MTILSDSAIVDLMATLYAVARPDTSPVASPPFDRVCSTDGVFWGVTGTVVVCRGSANARDWIRDGLSEIGQTYQDHPQLGLLPFGFSEGVREAYKAIIANFTPDSASLVFAGHSLGSAHATLLAALHVANGGNVARLVLCGSPRAGTQVLADYLAHVPTVDYWNGADPVPELPVPLPPLLPWTHLTVAPTRLSAPPLDPADPFAWHDVALYQRGVKGLNGRP